MNSNQKNIEDIAYLASCAVRREKPDPSRTEGMDLAAMYKIAVTHKMTSVCAAALESAGIRDEGFSSERLREIRRSALMDAEQKKILSRLEDAGIWYMPLKGAVLASDYPGFALRQMVDRDILIDAGRRDDVRKIMKELGYSVKAFGSEHHDVYLKDPLCFEMHTELFGPLSIKELHEGYRNVKESLVKDEGNGFGYHFTPEDFYLYMLAHEYKHYRKGGAGLRALLDIYVFLSKHDAGEEKLDWDYIRSREEILGIREFDERNKRLAFRLYAGESAPQEQAEGDDEMLSFMIASGSAGTMEHKVMDAVDELGGGREGKIRYFLQRIFLPMERVKVLYPFFYRHKILLPFLLLFRIGTAFTIYRPWVMQEIRTLFRKKEK